MENRKLARKRYIRGRDAQMREGETTKIGGIGYKGSENGRWGWHGRNGHN
jgi:hypothetical protein